MWGITVSYALRIPMFRNTWRKRQGNKWKKRMWAGYIWIISVIRMWFYRLICGRITIWINLPNYQHMIFVIVNLARMRFWRKRALILTRWDVRNKAYLGCLAAIGRLPKESTISVMWRNNIETGLRQRYFLHPIWHVGLY